MMIILDSILTDAESQEVHLEAPKGDNYQCLQRNCGSTF